MMTATRKWALAALITALLCPWLAFGVHALAIKAAARIGISSSSSRLRAWANELEGRSHKKMGGKALREQAAAIRLFLRCETLLWLAAVALAGAGGGLYLLNSNVTVFGRREYFVPLAGCQGVTLASSWWSPYALYINGVRASAGSGKRSFRIPRNDDRHEVEVRLAGIPLGDVPQLQVGDETVRVVPPLEAWKWGAVLFPLVLVFVGGALGGGLGGAAALTNMRILRSEATQRVQLLLVACTTAIAFVCYVAGALLLMPLFGR